MPRSLLPLSLSLLLAACAQTPIGTPEERDSAPVNPPDVSQVPDAVPKWEPRSRYGNPESYEVFGVRYHVMGSAHGFKEQGIASWYGTKFHGRRTSSGEPYNMYAMTAAHKHLPLPAYVRVTNLENDRQVVVRVNDRGPFAKDRIIDLSYAAAYRLDMLEAGTAPVKIEVLQAAQASTTSAQPVAAAPAPAIPEPIARFTYFIQVGAFSDRSNAERLRQRLKEGAFDAALEIQTAERPQGRLYRVRLGPVSAIQQVELLTAALNDFGITNPQVLVEE